MIDKKVVIGSFFTLILGLVTLSWYDFLFTPIEDPPQIIEIPNGANVKQIVQILKQYDIPPHKKELLLWIYLNDYQNKLKSGEYSVQAGMTLPQLIQHIVMGKVIQHSFTIIPGTTLQQVLTQMQSDPFLANEDTQSFLIKLNTLLDPQENTLEGLLLPDTYFFTKGTPIIELFTRAHKAQKQHLERLWQTRSSECILKTPYEAVILASIIEKESCDPSEYEKISGVFMRRLAKNIPLQADPTVIYGQSVVDGKITQTHLKTATPYNTYKKTGLPPTPIAIPSLGALKAALQPQLGSSLYFVAHPDGGRHVFSDTLQEHVQAVKNYRKSKSGN